MRNNGCKGYEKESLWCFKNGDVAKLQDLMQQEPNLVGEVLTIVWFDPVPYNTK